METNNRSAYDPAKELWWHTKNLMSDHSSRLQQILDLAECLARLGGYRNFSMQGIAEGLNVPTANVYSYFQNKEKLALAIVRRFGERVSERVGKPDDPSVLPEVKAATLVDVYRQSITDDGQLCLFLVFGAELHTLPEPVQLEVRNFYSHVIEWLQTVLKRTEQYASAPDEETRRVATAIIAAMNGAQLCVRAAGDKSLFDEIVKQQYASGLIPGHDRNGLTDS